MPEDAWAHADNVAGMLALLITAHPDDNKFKISIRAQIADRLDVTRPYFPQLLRWLLIRPALLKSGTIREVFAQKEECPAESSLLVNNTWPFGKNSAATQQDIGP